MQEFIDNAIQKLRAAIFNELLDEYDDNVCIGFNVHNYMKRHGMFFIHLSIMNDDMVKKNIEFRFCDPSNPYSSIPGNYEHVKLLFTDSVVCQIIEADKEAFRKFFNSRLEETNYFDGIVSECDSVSVWSKELGDECPAIIIDLPKPEHIANNPDIPPAIYDENLRILVGGVLDDYCKAYQSQQQATSQ